MNITPEPINLKPQPIIPAEKILFDSILEYLHHFWQYFIVSIIVSIPIGVLNIMSKPEINQWFLMILNLILVTLFGYYAKIALLSISGELLSNCPVTIGNIFLASFKLYLPFAWTMVMISAIWMFSACFCFIPAIIASVFFCVADGIVIWEGIYGIPALKRSVELAKPYFWRILWILVLFFLVFIMVFILFTEIPSLFLPTIPGFYKQLFNSQYRGMTTPWWYSLYRQLIMAGITPVSAIMTYILYRNLIEVNQLKEELPPELITPDNQIMQ